jgi:hypothetical protein
MRFDNADQQKLVANIVGNAQITTNVANMAAASAEMQALVKAITEAEIAQKPELVKE